MGTTGIYWEEARNVAKHHIMHRTAPTNKISQLDSAKAEKMSTVPKLRNLALVFIKCLSNFYLPSNVTMSLHVTRSLSGSIVPFLLS